MTNDNGGPLVIRLGEGLTIDEIMEYLESDTTLQGLAKKTGLTPDTLKEIQDGYKLKTILDNISSATTELGNHGTALNGIFKFMEELSKELVQPEDGNVGAYVNRMLGRLIREIDQAIDKARTDPVSEQEQQKLETALGNLLQAAKVLKQTLPKHLRILQERHSFDRDVGKSLHTGVTILVLSRISLGLSSVIPLFAISGATLLVAGLGMLARSYQSHRKSNVLLKRSYGVETPDFSMWRNLKLICATVVRAALGTPVAVVSRPGPEI